MRIVRLLTLVPSALGLVIAGATAASAADAALDGAWSYGGTCEETFAQQGRVVSFKKPVDLFAPAFIISGARLRTPMASCGIKSTRRVGDRRILKLSCATSIAHSDVTAILAPGPEGTLRRFSSDGDTIGSSYKRCAL
jgi:hypothetical protein